MNIKILIVEDSFIEADNLRIILRRAAYKICSIASSVAEALAIINKENPDLVLLDIFLQGKQTGIDLAMILKERKVGFVYLSANSGKKILDMAKSTQPYGFLVKPFREKDVLVTLDVAWYLHQQRSQSVIPAAATIDVFSDKSAKKIIGTSESMFEVLRHIKIASPSDISVLLLGESGTGKELVANSIHQNSARRTKPFVTVNCAALPAELIESELFGHEKGSFTGATEKRQGVFEQGNQGTVFLDEIGELPINMQVKLLRVLQEKEITPIGGKKVSLDVRIIAATNRILEEEVAAGRFRLDLYYRLDVFPILLPSLRERGEDILLLASHFLEYYARKENKQISGFSENVRRIMRDYSWPGNIRELENVIARSVLLSNGHIVESIQLHNTRNKNHLPVTPENTKTIDENTRDYIITVLTKCGGKIYGNGGAAEVMNLNPSTLKTKMRKLGINKKALFPKNNL